MRRKNDVYLDDAELEQIKPVAEKKGLSVSAYLRRVGVREARDELLEQESYRRLAADRQERYEATFNEPYPEPEPLPEPTLTPEPEKDPGRAMIMDEFMTERADALRDHRERLARLEQNCRHPGVAPAAVCAKCNRLARPRGSRGNVVTESRFRFHIPTRNGLGQ